jgi:hypothetical protein
VRQRLFKKGDRAVIIPSVKWNNMSRNGTIFSDEISGCDIAFRADGFLYTTGDYHEIDSANLDFEQTVVAVSGKGCICMKCNTKNDWAEPNRPDNKYLCFECR